MKLDPEILLWSHRFANVILTMGCGFLGFVVLRIRKRHANALAWITQVNFGLIGVLLLLFSMDFLLDFTCITPVRDPYHGMLELLRIICRLLAAIWTLAFVAHVIRFKRYVENSFAAIARDRKKG